MLNLVRNRRADLGEFIGFAAQPCQIDVFPGKEDRWVQRGIDPLFALVQNLEELDGEDQEDSRSPDPKLGM